LNGGFSAIAIDVDCAASRIAREIEMLVSGIKSKPVYRALAPCPAGQRHLLVAQGGGGEAIARLVDAFGAGAAEIEVYYSAESVLGADQSQRVQALSTVRTRCYSHCQQLESDLESVFSSARMGLRLYIAGTERFIWDITRLANAFGIGDAEIQQEHADSHARQVACVHCNALTYPVTTNIVACSGCGRHLLVRDHFSRRLNAYMGLQIDAEVPAELPPVKEVFFP
jgi:predicted RNA-binding Zn-ribbon protein involved in translation (DUF1610 family)